MFMAQEWNDVVWRGLQGYKSQKGVAYAAEEWTPLKVTNFTYQITKLFCKMPVKHLGEPLWKSWERIDTNRGMSTQDWLNSVNVCHFLSADHCVCY